MTPYDSGYYGVDLQYCMPEIEHSSGWNWVGAESE